LKRVVVLVLFVYAVVLSAEEMRIMPFGDSITYGDSYEDGENPRPSSVREAYRSHLYYKLRDINYSADFVGSLVAGESVSPSFDPDNEGHPGWSSYRLADSTVEFLEKNPPNVMLIHAGSNDHSDNIHGVENILNWIDYYEVQSQTKITVVLALIINKKEYESLITRFNDRLRDMANQRIAKGDSIVVVDMENDAGLNHSDYADNTHPNSRGYDKMANVWFSSIVNLGEKPLVDNAELRDYPYTLVDKNFIDYVYVDTENSSVTFATGIPDAGIKF